MSDEYAVTVELFCLDPSHPKKRVVVERLRGSWGTAPSGKHIAASWVVTTSATILDGSTVADESEIARRSEAIEGDNPELPGFPELRARYDFRCKLCGDSVVVRSEHLAPVLDALLLHGVSSISLPALRARIASSTSTMRD